MALYDVVKDMGIILVDRNEKSSRQAAREVR